MRNVLSLLVLLLLTLPALGQEITARLNFGRRDARPDYVEYIAADQGLATVGNLSRKSSRYQTMTKFDADFKKEWSKQVFQQNGRSSIDLVAALGDQLYVFISEYYPREGSIKTSYSQYDLDGNAVVERKVIDEVPNEKQHRVDLRYERSLNKRKLLCYKNLDQGVRNERITYYLFDAETDSVVRGEIQLPYPDDKFQVRKLVVSNSGKVFLLGKYYLVSRIKNPDDYGFKLYSYTPGNPEGSNLNIELGELFINDLTVRAGRDENLYLAGFYSHRSSEEIIGSCFFRVNPELEAEVQSTQRFSDDFLKNFLRDQQIDRGRELRNFYLDNIILRSDSGALLVAEKYYTSYNSYVDVYGNMIDQRIFHYDDVIVSSVGGNGDLEWSAVARKRQQAPTRESLSYLDVVSGESLYLIYGYDPKREPSTIYFQEVSMTGEVTERKPLLGPTAVDETFYPRSSEQISNSSALLSFFQERDKIFSVVKVEF
jgi:hypothetical protein